MDRQLVAFPRKETPGWSGGDPSKAQVFPFLSWDEFAEPQATDTMTAAYTIPGEGTIPRLNLGADVALRSMGVEPELRWVFMDLDRAGHAPWGSQIEAANALYTLLPLLPFPGAGGYTTRAGLRLVWALDPGLPISLANSFLTHFVDTVAEVVEGFEVDPVCKRWTTLYRAPRAKRPTKLPDGSPGPAKVLESFVHEPGEGLDPYQLWAEHGWEVTSSVEGGVVSAPVDMPLSPMELTFDDWKVAWAHAFLKVGQAIPEEDGHRYPVIRRILSNLASTGRITDPHKLVSYVWDSIDNTPGLDVSDIWRIACWMCDKERAKSPEPVEYSDAPPLEVERPSVEEWLAIRPFFRGRDLRMYARFLDGVRPAAQSARLVDNMFRFIRVLAEKAHIHDPEKLYAFCYRSMEYSAPDGPTPEEVWYKCRDAAAFAQHGDDNERARRLFVAEWPLTIKQVGKGGQLFQLDTTASPPRYVMTDPQAIYLHFDSLTRPNLPFEAEYPITVTVGDILRQYGATVEKVVYTSGQQGTVYDRAAGYISQGVHQLASVVPRYHEDVEGYLQALGGDDVDLLKSWLACATYTATEPLAALYLDGPPSSGKSFLFKLVASLWGSAWTDYNLVAGDFQGAMLQSPMLVADEGVSPGKWNEDKASDVFRRFVAETQHPINPKNKAPASLHGAVRVGITANGMDGLPFKKALGKTGIDAIVERVIYIKVGPEAKAYLNHLGGRAGVRDWLLPNGQPGRAAEHLLWLRDNHPVTPGKRFLVQGKPTDWHRHFAASQGFKPAVLAVVAGLAKRLQGATNNGIAVKADPDNGYIWVHHSAVFDHWGDFADIRRPKPAAVSDTLDMLADPEARHRHRFGDTRKTCVGLPFEAFVDAKILDRGDLGFK